MHSNMGSIVGDDEDEVLRKSHATPGRSGKNRRKRSDMVADPKKVVQGESGKSCGGNACDAGCLLF